MQSSERNNESNNECNKSDDLKDYEPDPESMTKRRSDHTSKHSHHLHHTSKNKNANPRKDVRNEDEETMKKDLVDEEARAEMELVAMRDRADADLALGLWPGHKSYEVGELLGRGSYGSVYEGRCRTTGKAVAIKRVDGLFSSKDVVRSSMREIELHVHVDISGGRGSVARLIEIVRPDQTEFDHMFSVFDKYDQNLHQALRTRKWQLVTFEERRVLAFKIAACVAKLHGCGVAHRDIKPENIVLKNEFHNVALCDLGMARMARMAQMHKEDRLTDYVTTRWYRAPEVCCGALSCACRFESGTQREGLFAADVWSLACVIGEILRDDNAPLFRGKSSEDQARLIGTALGPMDVESFHYYDSYSKCFEVYDAMVEATESRTPSLPELGIPDEAIDLLKKTLTYNPARRLTAAEVASHPFFKGLVETDGRPDGRPHLHTNVREVQRERERSFSTDQVRHNVKATIHECNRKLASFWTRVDVKGT